MSSGGQGIRWECPFPDWRSGTICGINSRTGELSFPVADNIAFGLFAQAASEFGPTRVL